MKHLALAIATAKVMTWAIFGILFVTFSMNIHRAAHPQSFFVSLLFTSIALGILSWKAKPLMKRAFWGACSAATGGLLFIGCKEMPLIGAGFLLATLVFNVLIGLNTAQVSYDLETPIPVEKAVIALIIEHMIIILPLFIAFRFIVLGKL